MLEHEVPALQYSPAPKSVVKVHVLRSSVANSYCGVCVLRFCSASGAAALVGTGYLIGNMMMNHYGQLVADECEALEHRRR